MQEADHSAIAGHVETSAVLGKLADAIPGGDCRIEVADVLSLLAGRKVYGSSVNPYARPAVMEALQALGFDPNPQTSKRGGKTVRVYYRGEGHGLTWFVYEDGQIVPRPELSRRGRRPQPQAPKVKKEKPASPSETDGAIAVYQAAFAGESEDEALKAIILAARERGIRLK